MLRVEHRSKRQGAQCCQKHARQRVHEAQNLMHDNVSTMQRLCWCVFALYIGCFYMATARKPLPTAARLANNHRNAKTLYGHYCRLHTSAYPRLRRKDTARGLSIVTESFHPSSPSCRSSSPLRCGLVWCP